MNFTNRPYRVAVVAHGRHPTCWDDVRMDEALSWGSGGPVYLAYRLRSRNRIYRVSNPPRIYFYEQAVVIDLVDTFSPLIDSAETHKILIII